MWQYLSSALPHYEPEDGEWDADPDAPEWGNFRLRCDNVISMLRYLTAKVDLDTINYADVDDIFNRTSLESPNHPRARIPNYRVPKKYRSVCCRPAAAPAAGTPNCSQWGSVQAAPWPLTRWKANVSRRTPPPPPQKLLLGRGPPPPIWGCPLRCTWPTPRAVAFLCVDLTQSSETGTDLGPPWHHLPRERKGEEGGKDRLGREREGTPW